MVSSPLPSPGRTPLPTAPPSPSPQSIDVLATGKLPRECSTSRCSYSENDEPPSWTSRPRHIVRFEPINGDETIDLSSKGFLRVGRSVKSDIQLSEITVSRKHAVIMHHGCGETFLLDVNSAHGTYVNNVRLPSNSPVRLRRGSLIRFGGSQAPLFLFKAFERLERLLEDVYALTKEPSSSSSTAALPAGIDNDIVKVVCGDSGVVCVSCNSRGEITKDEAGLATRTLVNTLLNAGGGETINNNFIKKLGIGENDEESKTTTNTNDNNKRTHRVTNPDFNAGLCDEVGLAPPPNPFFSPSPKPVKRRRTTPPSKNNRVVFSSEPPSVYYPTPITPEENNSESSETGSDSGDSTDSLLVVDHASAGQGKAQDDSSVETDEPTPPPSPPQVDHKSMNKIQRTPSVESEEDIQMAE
ncbi:hypothetical protein TrLO_g1953 [Triparma laevis f. longispina]|uniref:FHA domain-containing protein n=1 Tax=Triparma laevis f. longispina TaxID=1714387 RepID=A0A9W7AC66_9STRA|nr:hypothetical protein TrLO_g1953 [Triparma laevis f. longispina]